MQRWLVLLLVGLLVVAAPAAAAERFGRQGMQPQGFLPFPNPGVSGQDRSTNAVRQGQIQPLGTILASIQRQFAGRQLDVDLRQGGGAPWTYNVKWLTPEGEVLYIVVDAASAQILNVAGGGRRRR